MTNNYGLIGYPLGHSFSKEYFSTKFAKNKSADLYELFELKNISELTELLKSNQINGLNVTIPYKKKVIPFLHSLDRSAQLVGAVNVIKVKDNKLIGFNTDYPAFKETLKKWLNHSNLKALILGTGGASKAVIAGLNDLKIQFHIVSRTPSDTKITYQALFSNLTWIKKYRLIINTTPVGMAPKIDLAPELPYHLLTPHHYLYDLVYNPEESTFLKQGKLSGAKIKNGLEMLYLQAELSWNIWNT